MFGIDDAAIAALMAALAEGTATVAVPTAAEAATLSAPVIAGGMGAAAGAGAMGGPLLGAASPAVAGAAPSLVSSPAPPPNPAGQLATQPMKGFAGGQTNLNDALQSMMLLNQVLGLQKPKMPPPPMQPMRAPVHGGGAAYMQPQPMQPISTGGEDEEMKKLLMLLGRR